MDDWQGEIWRDILGMHYGHISESDIEEKYGGLYANARLTVSTPNVLRRFKGMNEGQEWPHQIKPFNFLLVGFQVTSIDGKPVKPLVPFSRNYQEIVHKPFVDYESGEVMEGVRYFKPLSSTILQYVMHHEYKFDGDVGFLKRKEVRADGIVYIRKEAINIDEEAIEVKDPQIFIN